MLNKLKIWLGLNSVQSQVEAMLEEIKTPAKKKAPAKKAPSKKAPAKKTK